MTDDTIFDAFHDPALSAAIANALHGVDLPDGATFMHVCGTHEHAIGRAGIRSLLPQNLRLVAGPGCPVCVCPASDIDLAVEATKRDNVIVATFGDMFRVPATHSSLEMRHAEGSDVRVVYSPLDAVRIARENPDHAVVFMAVGFETTAGPIAAALLDEPPANFFIIPSLRLIPPALAFLLERGTGAIDGFILPGHVSVVLGRAGYRFLESRYQIPAVISGFEPVDVIRAILELSSILRRGQPYTVVNCYRRVVGEHGNARTRELLARLFSEADVPWRGIGTIPASGLELREPYRRFDAREALDLTLDFVPIDVREGCMCHRVILGETEPEDCPLFGVECSPSTPYGPCMVSSEGTCRARYQYRRV
jgi:hydrogenase expression/formation protein HypD